MTVFRPVIVALILAVGIPMHAPQAQAGVAPYQAIVAVGDSLTDTGNLYARTLGARPLSPPYDNGRFSNGPVWVEVMAGWLGLPEPAAYSGPATVDKTNFAVGGATTGSKDEPPIGQIGMVSQVQQIADDPAVRALLPDALTVVWGGSNDFFDSAATGYDADPRVSVANLVARIESLIGLGAETFLLVNLTPLGETPAFRGTLAAPLAEAFSAGFNSAYRSAVAGLASANTMLDFFYLDVAAIFDEILADPAGWGYANVTDPAFNGSSVVADPDDYLFWDDVHPTRIGHAQLGAIAAQLVLVPAPPPPLLLATGLFVLALARRRRALDNDVGERRNRR